MSYFSVDIEADGPAPGLYSMISFGAVVVEPDLNRTFYAELKPISDRWIPDALAVSGFTREQTIRFEEPIPVMTRFEEWVNTNSKGRPIFIADNPGFDFAKWKHLRETRHSHNALDDAKGNAEAILKMQDMGLKIRLD
jgi:DNA polymerase III epsilon subunit-like protein